MLGFSVSLKRTLVAVSLIIFALLVLGTESRRLILRPKLIPTFTPCIQLSEWGTYTVPKGTIIEIAITYPNSVDCPHDYTYEMIHPMGLNGRLERGHVVVETLGGPWQEISGELTGEKGTYTTRIHFFQAKKRGNIEVAFTIGNNLYEYFFNVT